MKLTHVLESLMVVTTVGTTLALPSTPAVAATLKPDYSMATLPKKIRGHWYKYRKVSGHYHYQSLILGKKTVTMKTYVGKGWHTYRYPLQRFNMNATGRETKAMRAKAPKTAMAFTMNDKSTAVGTWDFFEYGQAKPKKGMLFGDYFKPIQKTYRHKRVKVLVNAAPSEAFSTPVTAHWYQTKAQAKYFDPTGAIK